MSEQIITIILIAVVLGIDAFSLALAMGLSGVSKAYEYKFATAVTAFHILMPLAGLYLGYTAGQLLETWASLLGAVVLTYVGITFIIEGYREVKPQPVTFKRAKKTMLSEPTDSKYEEKNILLYTASVSIDALTTGFSMGVTDMPVFLTVIMMGITAGLMTLAGFRGGRIFGRLAGNYAQVAGGIILLGLAVRIVL